MNISEFCANYVGPLDFNVSFHPPEKPTKNVPWTYSEDRDKLYVIMGMNVPLNFHTSIHPPAGTNIIITSAYIKAAYSLTPVQRCLTHQNPAEAYNRDHPALDHLIRCESHEGVYSTDERTSQKVLTLPYTKPEVGTDFSTYIFKFMCWSSCVGGMNRRRIRVIFKLQYQEKCIGQRSFEVRVCACPGRDCKADDREYLTVRKEKAADDETSDNYEDEGPVVKKGRESKADDNIIMHVVKIKKEKETDGESSDNGEVEAPVFKKGFPSFREFSRSCPPLKRSKEGESGSLYWLSYKNLQEYEFMKAVRSAYRSTHRS